MISQFNQSTMCRKLEETGGLLVAVGYVHIPHTIDYTTEDTHHPHIHAPEKGIHKVQCIHTYTGREVKESPRTAVACVPALPACSSDTRHAQGERRPRREDLPALARNT